MGTFWPSAGKAKTFTNGLTFQNGCELVYGSGSPETVVTATIGTIYIDTVTGDMYNKKTGVGNTGWKPTPADSTSTQNLYVNWQTGNDTTGTGSFLLPYATIQKALSMVPAATTNAEAKRTFLINIATGQYDEDLSIDIGRKKVILVAQGPVNVGVFDGASLAPSGATTRNINITCSLGNLNSIRCSFGIVVATQATSFGTHQQYSDNFRLAGTLNISNSTGGSSGEFMIRGAYIFGYDGVAAGNNASIDSTTWAGNCNTYLETVRCAGVIAGGVTRLQHARDCQFDKLITLATYSQIKESVITAGMTWSVAPSEVLPTGIFNSNITGTFTGAAGVDLLMDAFTTKTYYTNACSIAGGASIVLTDDARGINAVTTNFNGGLSATENTAQLALERLDDFNFLGNWTTALIYRVGNIVRQNNKLYRANAAHTANVFNTDIANWDLVTSFETWVTAYPYKVDQLIIVNQIPYRCNTAHISSAAFTTDIASWDLVKGLETWITAHAYKVDQFVINNNTLYRANTAHIASAAFATDIANWDLISAPSTLSAWAPATVYSLGASVHVMYGQYVCISAHTSSAAFITDAPTKWRRTNEENYIAFDKAYGATLTGWATYADAAGTLPVDGTGGAPNVTLAQNTTTPLNGIGDFRLVKDAANRQGQGFSYDFVINPMHYAKVMQVSFDYEVISGTYADADIKIAVIDTTSGAVIELADSRLFSGVVGNKLKYRGTFQTNYTGTTYRLCVHVSSVNAVAYTLDFNNFSVWEQNVSSGFAGIDWTPFTMNIGATSVAPTRGTGVTEYGFWRRLGSNMEIRWDYKQTGAGTSGTGNYVFVLPNNASVDTSKITTALNNEGQAVVGTAAVWLANSANNSGEGTVQVYDTQRLTVNVVTDGSQGAAIGSSYMTFGNASLRISFFASVPIAGWGSNVVMSSETDTRVVSMTYSNNSANTTGGTDGFKCVTKIEDTHNFYNTTTGAITIPVAGTYEFGASITTSGSINGVYLWRVRNGGAFTQVAFMGAVTSNGTTATCSYPCLAGDVMYISGNAAATITVSAQTYANITCFRLSGPSSIASTETIAARYTHGGGATIDGSVRLCNFATKIFDTHGAVTTGASWKFTAPVSGLYYMQGMLRNNSSTSYMNAYIYKNGAAYTSYHTAGNVNIATTSTCFALVNLLAGEYMDYRYDGLAAGTSTGEINIYKVGNYA